MENVIDPAKRTYDNYTIMRNFLRFAFPQTEEFEEVFENLSESDRLNFDVKEILESGVKSYQTFIENLYTKIKEIEEENHYPLFFGWPQDENKKNYLKRKKVFFAKAQKEFERSLGKQ